MSKVLSDWKLASRGVFIGMIFWAITSCDEGDTMSIEKAATSEQVEVKKGEWLEDYDKGFELAREDGKLVLLKFTGSDWCPPCKMMKKRVFGKPEFISKASEKFILIKLDLPKRSRLEVARRNEPYFQKHGVSSFPTVIILDSQGVEIERFIASGYPSVDSFLQKLDAIASSNL